ncbi:hypothetical protein [Candidatus Amarobacter glycogenicus]|uniref:hypothetical protein n=1 Tax=Candidatus Amarobacter glycogenicus TaxID=3140699 RepID=UPI0031CC53AE
MAERQAADRLLLTSRPIQQAAQVAASPGSAALPAAQDQRDLGGHLGVGGRGRQHRDAVQITGAWLAGARIEQMMHGPPVAGPAPTADAAGRYGAAAHSQGEQVVLA